MLSVIDVSAGEVVYPPGGRLGPRRQHDLQLVLVHTGSARIAIDDGEPALVPSGWVRLLLPGHREAFAFADREPTHHSWVQARVREIPPRFLEVPVVLPLSTALAELVRQAVGATSGDLAAALAAAAFWRYLADAQSAQPDSAVDRARAFVHAHVGDPDVDLPAVAAAAHVTPAHLVRRFRAELGVTPMAYLWQRRVALGIDLLTRTGLPVGDVAARAGFKSVYHFSRRIRAHTGVPPTEVRRDRWGEQSPSST